MRKLVFVSSLLVALGVSDPTRFAGSANAQEAAPTDATATNAAVEEAQPAEGTGETESAETPEAAVEPEPAPEAEPAPPPPAAAAPAQPTPAPAKDMIGVIDFQGTPLNAVLEYYAGLTKRSIISAPNLAGAIFFRSQTDLSRDEAIQALDSVLALNGIGLVPLGDKLLKVVQIQTAKQEGIGVGVDAGKRLPPADNLMTQILPLKYVDAADVIGALQPYVHPYGQLIPLTKSNSILITDTGGNINQMMEIVRYVDQPSALRMQTKVWILQHAKAADVVARMQAILQETQQIGARAAAPGQPTPPQPRVPPRPGAPSTAAAAPAEESIVEGKVILTADERTNKIFILSRPSNFDFFDKLIAELDAKVEPDVTIRVFNLDYAPAEDVASLINALITGGTLTVTRRPTTPGQPRAGVTQPPPAPTAVSVAGGVGTGEAGGFLQFAQGVRILPDPRTNSLLVMATKEDMERIAKLIESVDTPVAQVLIEVVIAEISLDNNLEVAVSAFKRAFKEGQVVQAGGYVNRTPPPQDVIGDIVGTNTIQAASLASGFLTWFATFQNTKLDVLLRAMAASSKFKVLSTPIIQTMHNQEADIIVGESRPVPVSTVSGVVGGTGTLTTGQLTSNIEYKDIAIELKVTPRVNPGGYVTMDIEQKVNDVGGQVSFSGTDIPIITKREAKSAVIVKDQGTIVLGGLIKESKVISESKVPFVGDIPFFGAAFKGKSTIKTRNELILFIRPSVLRNQSAAVAEAVRRTNMLKAGRELNLEEQFLTGPATDEQAPTNDVPPSTVEPTTDDQSSNFGNPANGETDRYTAKIKALQEQVQTRAE